MTRPVYIGLISGTSRDGLDAVLVTLEGSVPRLLHALCRPYPAPLRDDLDALIHRLLEENRRPEAAETAHLDLELGEFFADTVQALLAEAGFPAEDVHAIGSHGQTVWHEPGGPEPLSVQLGDAEVLHRLTGIPVVSDFRAADVAAGGQGAPLAPLLHRALFRDQAPCAVLNLGGIANVTLLTGDGDVLGYDTGPANCLLDAWHQRHRGGAYDEGGAWAAGGMVLPALLERLLDDTYFRLPPPKSTGLETFNLAWLERRLAGDEDPRDVQRTLLELTVRSVADGLRQDGGNTGNPFAAEHAPLAGKASGPGAPEIPEIPEILVCGGGTHNATLMDRLAQALSPTRVRSTAHRGVDPDWVEATLFAWLAHERLAEQPMTTGPITGARRPVLLGRVSPSTPPAPSVKAIPGDTA
ncbi:MAG: anhydro-N-acetylmuramic acid kinase [Xanthomonadales bacterium]|nr:anhydro-N-acetylmuramic acid kinase [Xanthomonadales bacterium]